jgi:predicted ATPase/DNA-binding SARP family transcriptional activator/class 3 adenylate cyclase
VTVEFRILGTLEVLVGDCPVALGGSRPRTLLAALLLRPNEVLSLDRLGDAVWRGEPPPSAVNTLHTYVTRLRKVLEPDRRRGDASRILVSHPTGYSIRLGASQLDALRFEALADDGRAAAGAGDAEVAAERLAEALGLWRGPALAEFAGEAFAAGRLAQLEERRLVAVEHLMAARLELGHHDELDGELERLVAEHPLRERFCELRMLALYRSGRQADALRACQALRDQLRDDLGLTPSRAVLDLEQAILVQSAALDWDHPPATATAGDRGVTGVPVEVDRGPGRHREARPLAGRVPTGTVTFLFTDIEDSTRLWEQHPDAMQAAVERHDAIVRSTIDRQGGYVFSTAGDAFAAAFQRAQEAVAAAVEAQHALGAEVWPAACSVRVRMGLHVGEAQERGGGYFGPVVNRTARIMAVGHGGQVLASGTLERLLRDVDVAGASLRSLGEVQLRGLGRAEEVFELRYPGLVGEFPPLVAPLLRRGGLPRVADRLIGRDDLLAEVLRLVADAPLVTLVGPGGVGKTRLAVEVGAELADRLGDGVWFCELAPVAADDGVADAVAEVLAVQKSPTQPLIDSIVGALAGRHLLLVLDNCEHVLDGARALVAALVAAGSTVVVLTTSRQPLALRGERVVAVPPLAVPGKDAPTVDTPAARLFVERARSADPQLALTSASVAAIGAICRRLDGMPLALELAAGRVRGLGIEGLAERLDDQLRLLRNRAELDRRHQTLRATIGWSYDLLDRRLQRVFCRASVFAGSFTLDAAERVVGFGAVDAGNAADGVAELVDKSMLQTIDTAAAHRYRMLETADQALRGPDPAPWLAALDDEFDNLRETYRLAAGAGDLEHAARLVVALHTFSIRYVVGEPRRWACDLADRLEPTCPLYGDVLAVALFGARAYRGRGATGELLRRLERAEVDGQLEPSAFCDEQVAAVLWMLGQTERAIAKHDRAISKARASHDQVMESWILANLSMAQDAFDRDLAAASARSAIAVARASDNSLGIALGLVTLAGAIVHKNPDQALPVVDELLTTAQRCGARWNYAHGLRLKAHALSRAGRLTDASGAYTEALELNGVGDFGELLWYTVANIIEHLQRAGRSETAAVALGKLEAAGAPRDALIRRSMERSRRDLDTQLGADRRSALEGRGPTLNLSEFLALLDDELRRHATRR